MSHQSVRPGSLFLPRGRKSSTPFSIACIPCLPVTVSVTSPELWGGASAVLLPLYVVSAGVQPCSHPRRPMFTPKHYCNSGLQPRLYHHERRLPRLLPPAQVHRNIYLGRGKGPPRVHFRSGRAGEATRTKLRVESRSPAPRDLYSLFLQTVRSSITQLCAASPKIF